MRRAPLSVNADSHNNAGNSGGGPKTESGLTSIEMASLNDDMIASTSEHISV